MITDPWFYVLAAPAVLIYGIGKGGLGGALGIVAVPMLSIVVSPVQAAGILLPILLVMDAFAVRHHYKKANYKVIQKMLPGAVLGILLAGLFLSVTPEFGLKMAIGVLSLLFCVMYCVGGNKPRKKPGLFAAGFWSLLTGFSSTAIHAGGGPASIYLLPLKLPKVTLIATMAVLFGMINVIKIIPYLQLGEFDYTNLITAMFLMPLAPIGVKIGVILLHIVSQERIYQLCYLFLLLSGIKLTYDGMLPLL